jgi:hypothetical protein
MLGPVHGTIVRRQAKGRSSAKPYFDEHKLVTVPLYNGKLAVVLECRRLRRRRFPVARYAVVLGLIALAAIGALTASAGQLGTVLDVIGPTLAPR